MKPLVELVEVEELHANLSNTSDEENRDRQLDAIWKCLKLIASRIDRLDPEVR